MSVVARLNLQAGTDLRYLDSKRVEFRLLSYVKEIFQQPAGALTES